VNQSFTYIANDGNLLPSPLTMSKVAIAPGERADIVIDFSKYETGTSLFLVNRLAQTDGRGPDGESDNPRNANGLLTKKGTQILRFDIGTYPKEKDVSQVPAKLRALPDIDLTKVVKTREFKFNKTNGFWAVNGNIYNGEKATATPKRGTAEIWVLEGGGNWHHPVHVHLEEGRILTRNGRPPPLHERGRKDVYVLEPGEVVRVFIQFRDFTGKYTMHCHNTTHEDHAMMIRFDVVE
jgi:FtsP/CotA-like multicopper oxidase with cupredoxin domain